MISRILLASGLFLAALLPACLPPTPGMMDPSVLRTFPAEPFTHPTGIQFVLLPAGSVEHRISKDIKHEIQMLRPTLIGACEVTNAQFEKFAPAHPRAKSSPGDNDPVANVTPEEAEAFCKWLTQKDLVGRLYSLPRPEDWEYAARAGRDSLDYPWGNQIDPSQACYAAKAAKPVGSYPPNRFGIRDIAGNVAEWVATGDIPPYQLRGGAWSDEPDALRIEALGKLPEKTDSLDHHGFRVLCEPPLLR